MLRRIVLDDLSRSQRSFNTGTVETGCNCTRDGVSGPEDTVSSLEGQPRPASDQLLLSFPVHARPTIFRSEVIARLRNIKSDMRSLRFFQPTPRICVTLRLPTCPQSMRASDRAIFL